jgi:hypothetical protein
MFNGTQHESPLSKEDLKLCQDSSREAHWKIARAGFVLKEMQSSNRAFSGLQYKFENSGGSEFGQIYHSMEIKY